MLSIGKVLKSDGTDGSILLGLLELGLEDIDLKEPVFIVFDGLEVPFFISSIRAKGSTKAVVKFRDVDSLADAEELIGREVFLEGELEDEQELDLSGWTGGTITNVSMSDRPVVGDNRAEPALIVGTGAGHIQDLTYSNWLIGKISQTTLSGGSYGKIVWMNHEYSEQPAFPTSAMLASGYAFKNSDGSYVLYTKTLERNEAFANVSVVQCPHGALTTDASGALRCGYCNADMSGFAVEITDKDGNTGYSSDPADGFYRAYIVKVKLLKDCNDYGEVNHAMTIDLNGKTIRGLTIAAAGVQIIDSAETKGSIGTLTVTADGVTLRDLLADGYGFRSTDGTWVAEGAATASNVTIAKVPIKDVYFFEGEDKEENKITSLTKTYGETRTLYAGID